MAVIPDRLPASSLEIVRDQIGTILALEIAEQATLNMGVDDTLSALLTRTTVFAERFEPFADNEFPAIAFYFFNGSFDNKFQHSKRGTYHYYLDLFTSSKSNANQSSSQVASVNAHRIAMIIHDILEDPRYLTLGLPTSPSPIIQGTNVINIKRTEEENTASALGTMMYRIIFEVRVTENTQTITGVPLVGQDTTVRIDQTNLGYQYSYQAP